MNASLTCPRCKTENIAEQRFCQKCGFGLYKTDSLEGTAEVDLMRPENLIGRTIGEKYRVLSVLGEGGFGTVFKVEQVLLGRNLTFALKLLHRELTSNDHFRARFVREASIAMELVHPNAIQVRDFGETEHDQLYFTMDFCRGESLKELIAREGYLTVNRAMHIVSEVLGVLEVAHEKQIIHRDIKPENVFIERSGDGEEIVKVGDFGLARNVGRGSASGITKGGIVGTPRYMSPEQSKGEPLDGRSDLYAVGVIFYEMISGDVPPRLDRKRKNGKNGKSKNGQSTIEVSPHARLRENLPEGVVVPAAVLDLIARGLEAKPSARFRNATEFRESIELLPTYTPTYIEPKPEPRRSPFASVSGWAIALLLLTFAFMAFTPVGQRLLEGIRSVAMGDADPNDKLPKAQGGNKEDKEDQEKRSDSDDSSDPKKVTEDSGSDGINGEGGAKTDDGSGDNDNTEDAARIPVTPEPPRPEPLGDLKEWVQVRPADPLTLRKYSGSGVPTLYEARVSTQQNDDYGYMISEKELGADKPPTTSRHWKVLADEFREIYVSSKNNKTTQWSLLQWDPILRRPKESWTSRGYDFTSKVWESDFTIDRQTFQSVIEVVGKKTFANGDVWIRKCYFERGTGLVVTEKFSGTAEDPEAQFDYREVRLVPAAAPK